MTGTKFTPVHYRGATPALTDTVGGHIQMMIVSIGLVAQPWQSGQLKVLGFGSTTRIPEFPDVPTLVELGYPELIVRTWYSLSGPAGLPRDIVDRLNAAVNKAMELPEVQKHLAAEMVQTQAMTPQQITAFMQREVAQWAPTARRISEQK
jgi:tripartite-type tricarboxylate transporter receptor subunit TctC